MASFGKPQIIHKSNEIEFIEFVYDRQEVWHNRFVKKIPMPWSKNEILNKYKFCNVYRELDKCSIYLIDKICNNDSLSFAEKVFNILVFRIFNVDKLFDEYFHEPLKIENPDFKKYEEELDKAKANGKNLFNNAYNITQRTYCSEYRKTEKHVQHLLNLKNILEQNFNDLIYVIKNAGKLEIIFHAIESLNFFGPFLAYQCCTDISYVKDGINLDWNEFVVVGPGAKGGIDAIFGKTNNYEEKCFDLYLNQKNLFTKLYQNTGKDWLTVAYQSSYNKTFYLSLSNIQNCCCEFRKFLNYKNKIKCRKKYYKPYIINQTNNPYASLEA